MLFRTHVIFAFLVGLLSMAVFHPSNQILFILLVMFAGMLPDIDHPKAKLGKYFKYFYIFEHRGFMHSFLVLPLIALLLYFLKYPQFALPIVIGYSSHLISDLVTKEGIMPLHPISRFRLHGFIKTGGLIELLVFAFLLVASTYLLFHI